MISVREIKMKPGHTREDLVKKAAQALKKNPAELEEFRVIRQSIDARKKPEVWLVYEVWVCISGISGENAEQKYLKKLHNTHASYIEGKVYQFPFKKTSKKKDDNSLRPVVIGMGPAGMFCALELSRAGYRPIIFERGQDVAKRTEKVEHFWQTGELDPESNVQFGEGGAGTFSDGKLNTLVKESKERHRHVLETFVKYGANDDILYSAKPHVGTDVLRDVVKSIRQEILNHGGEIYFEHKLIDLSKNEDGSWNLVIQNKEKIWTQQTPCFCLAIGHSARDTFSMLYEKQIPMEAKPFAMGLRMEHPQSMVNLDQYGMQQEGALPTASYKLTAKTESGRGVYTFCMCPGGFVVNASSEKNRLCVNGMSYHDRGSRNANSAVIVTVTPDDYPDQTPLGGVHFQQQIEEKAFKAANGKIPVQTFGDFCKNQKTTKLGEIEPCVKGQYALSNVRGIYPEQMMNAFEEGVHVFGRKMKGFDREDALLLAAETRTSSPVRILRDETLQSAEKGFFPCGEGAGYAGGITSASIDGIRVAEAMANLIENM